MVGQQMRDMTICVNGTKRQIPQGTTLERLVEQFQLKTKSVVLELNQKVMDRNVFSATELKDNDTIEIVHFVGGG